MTVLRLPWPPKALSSNARVHWAKRAKWASDYRFMCGWLTKEAGVPMLDSVVLQFRYFPPDRRHRDAQNMPVSLKAAIDGIADALGRDDRDFQCVFPSEFGEPTKGGAILVEIGEGQ